MKNLTLLTQWRSWTFQPIIFQVVVKLYFFLSQENTTLNAFQPSEQLVNILKVEWSMEEEWIPHKR